MELGSLAPMSGTIQRSVHINILQVRQSLSYFGFEHIVQAVTLVQMTRNYVVYKLCSGYSSGGTYSCIGKNRVASNVEREATKTLDISVSKEVSVSLTPSRLDSTV